MSYVPKDGETRWAREFECGCREVDEDAKLGAGDTCPTHGDEIVCGGYLTTQSGADRLLGEVERLRMKADWQPIETAPRDGTEIVVVTDVLEESPRTREAYVVVWSAALEAWIDDRNRAWFYTLTHWMPLPDPPDQAAHRADELTSD